MAELLRFALPALGISLSGPILSNIDNAFVGRLTGPEGLAALSPGTVVADYMLYLLVFLPRATVGLVSRAFASGGAKAAQPELQRALSVAMPIGVTLSVVYLTCTESILKMLHVAPNLIPYAATYARVRGAVTWAALSQTVCLSALLATKDSWTPLKVVGVAAVANCCGDFALCVWPFRLGVGGAAAATSIATLLSFALMVRALRAKELLPKKWFRLPSSARYLAPLMEYAGPLLIVVATRMVSLSAMALSAAALGTTALAGYQILINLFTLFALVGEPLSQAAQALLPPLLEKKDTAGARRATKSLLFLGLSAGAVAGAGSFACAAFGGGTFSGDSAVIDVVHRSAPVLMFAVAALVFAYPVDGAMLATKNFRVLIALSIFGLVAQLPALQLITRSFSGTRQPALALKLLMMTMFVRLLTLSLFSLARLWADLQVKPATDGEERQ